jgi:hypothetical protein
VGGPGGEAAVGADVVLGAAVHGQPAPVGVVGGQQRWLLPVLLGLDGAGHQRVPAVGPGHHPGRFGDGPAVPAVATNPRDPSAVVDSRTGRCRSAGRPSPPAAPAGPIAPARPRPAGGGGASRRCRWGRSPGPPAAPCRPCGPAASRSGSRRSGRPPRWRRRDARPCLSPAWSTGWQAGCGRRRREVSRRSPWGRWLGQADHGGAATLGHPQVAVPGRRDQLGLGLAPAPGGREDAAVVGAAEGGRDVPPPHQLGGRTHPLVGPRDVIDQLTRPEEEAHDRVHGRELPQLPGAGGRRRLVEEGQALLHPIGHEQHAAEKRQRLELDVGVVEAASDGDGVAEQRLTGLRVRLGEVPDDEDPAAPGPTIRSAPPTGRRCSR